MRLTLEEQAIAEGAEGPASAMALRVVVDTARILGAERLVPVVSAHIDGCLYHGDAGVFFAERLVELGAKVAVPASLNVGALDLLHPELVRGDPHHHEMSKRLMTAYTAMGCLPTWTCAPYQAGHRPGLGDQIAWAESNAVAFANSVLGARTNRYGDFLDICCAISGRAPLSGLHVTENRRARLHLDCSRLSHGLLTNPAFYPVLGALLGNEAGETVATITGLPADLTEDDLKALGAAAASKGAVGLFHVVGVTPEAPTLEAACQGEPPAHRIVVTPEMVRAQRDALSTTAATAIDCVALGSPHFSRAEFDQLLPLLTGRALKVPFYVCTGRATVEGLAADGLTSPLAEAGVTLVTDTCVVVTPILADSGKVMMTNSAKFAHYAQGTIGYDAVFGTLSDCVASAKAGRLLRDEGGWQ
jgi:predicted aconitase